MTDERFNELVNGPLSHPVGPLFMLRLANALRMVVERCGGAGDVALEAHCKEVGNWIASRAVRRSRMKKQRERCTTVCGGAGVNQYDIYKSGE